MRSNKKTVFMALAAVSAAATLLAACVTQAPGTGPMSFFVSSVGSGKGADLGGLAGADALCQKLAGASGATGASGKTWRAYLSVPPTLGSGSTPGVAAVHARDRIGKGPWYNAKGELIARDLIQLHDVKYMMMVLYV
jgi:hypothetical protein